MTTGKRIRNARRAKGWTQKELAKRLDLATGTVQQYELGKRNPSLEMLRKIAEALDVTIPDFIDIDDVMGPLKPLDEKSPDEIIALIKNNMVTLDKNKRPIWRPDTPGLVDGSVLDEEERQQDLLVHFHKLNEPGQQMAVKQVELLTTEPSYQKE